MKKLIGELMVAAFCGAAGLAWAGAAGEANKATPPFLPPDQKPKFISGQTGKVMPNPKMNGPKVGKNLQTTKSMEGAGIYYYFKPDGSGHSLVTGKAGNEGNLNAGGKALPKMNGPKDGKYTQTTVKKVGKEVLVNYMDGDPDKPIITGQAHNGAATTAGR